MPSTKWPRRADFVNMVLFYGVVTWNVEREIVDYDGIAGPVFDLVVKSAESDKDQDVLINLALDLNVPVAGLLADHVFGGKWREVIALAKATDDAPAEDERA